MQVCGPYGPGPLRRGRRARRVGVASEGESVGASNARLERVGDESVNVPHEREQESMAGGVLFWKALCYACALFQSRIQVTKCYAMLVLYFKECYAMLRFGRLR